MHNQSTRKENQKRPNINNAAYLDRMAKIHTEWNNYLFPKNEINPKQ